MSPDMIAIMLLALLIFGMVLVVLFIILRAKQQSKKEFMTAEEYAAKEEKLMMLYFEVEDMINGLKEYVEHAREVLSLEYDRVQAQAAGLRVVQQAPAEAAPFEPPPPVHEEDDSIPEQSKRDLYDIAAQMLREGKATAEIAEELHLSRSEVAMIQRLA